jgi:pimeloyl-ACP methyl ester carboxylesterase
MTRSFPTPTSSRWLRTGFAVAAALAACALVVRRQTQTAEADFPPKGRFIDVDGVRLHYLEHGEAAAERTVVMLHGNGTMAEDFELSGLPDLAAQRYRVIVFDRPGFGYSTRPRGRAWGPEEQADLLGTALEHLGVRAPVVVGHSWGASVALAMGLRRPSSVRGLVLVSGYHTPSLRLDVVWASLPAVPVIGTLLRHTVSPLLGRLLWPVVLRRMFAPAATPASFKQRYPVWMSLRPSQLRASAAESARMIPMTVSLQKDQRRLAVPAVIVAGASDRLVDTRWSSSRLSERLPESWLRVVEGKGHMVHHTATGQVMAAIDQAARLTGGGQGEPARASTR